MAEPIDFGAKRKAKETKCALCGNAVHDFIGQCPRICAITEETDGSATYHLHPIEDEPKDSA